MTISLSRAVCRIGTPLFKAEPLFREATTSFSRSISHKFECQKIAFRPFSQSMHLVDKGRALFQVPSDKSRAQVSIPVLKVAARYFSKTQTDCPKFQFPSEEVLLKQLKVIVPSEEQQIKLAKFLANSTKTKVELIAGISSIIWKEDMPDSLFVRYVLAAETHDIIKDLLAHCTIKS